MAITTQSSEFPSSMFGSQMLSNSDTWKVNDDNDDEEDDYKDDNDDFKPPDGFKVVHLESRKSTWFVAKPNMYPLGIFVDVKKERS